MAEGLWFNIGADNTQFKQKAKETNSALTKMSENVKAFSKGMTASFTEAAKSMAGFYAVAKAGTIFQDLIAQNDQFNKSMKEVSTLSEEVAKNLDTYKKKVLEMTTQIPIAANDAAKALYQINSAGHTGADGMKVLEVSAKAAIGGVTDTAVAADAITTVLNAYKMSADDASKVSDKLFTAVRLGKTTMGELGSTISTVAPLAASYGVSIDQVLAAVATLTKQGTATGEAFTNIRSAIISMGDALGSTYFQTHTLQEGLIQMRESFPDNNKLKEVMGRIQGVQAVLGMTGENAKTAAADLNEFAHSAGAAGTAFDKMNSGKGVELSKLQNNIMKEMSSVSDEISKVIGELAKKINEAFDSGKIDEVINSLKELITIFGIYKTTAISLIAAQKAYNVVMEEYRYQVALANVGNKTYIAGQAGMAVATKTVTAAQAMQSTAIALLSRAWQGLSTAIKANPIGIAATAFTMAAGAMYLIVKRAHETTAEYRNLDNAVKNTAKDIEAQNAKIKESVSTSVSDEIAKLKSLQKTLKDSKKSYSEREKALVDIQAIVPAYHAQLSKEGELINNNTNAISDYIAKLKQKAKAEAAYSMLVENEKKLLVLQNDKEDAEQKRAATKANRKKKGIGNNNKNLAPDGVIYGGEAGVEAYLNSIDKDEAKFDKYEKIFDKRIETRSKQIDMLNKQNDKLSEIYEKNKREEETTKTTTPVKIADPKAEEAAKKAKEELERQKETQEQIYQEILRLQQQNEDDRISLLKDGAEKRRQEIENEFAKEQNTISQQAVKWAKENKKAGIKGSQSITVNGESYGGLNQVQQDTLAKAIESASAKRLRNLFKADEEFKDAEVNSMNEYLKAYGTYEEKKLAITEEYNKKILEAQTEGEKLTLQKQMEEAIKNINKDEFKENMNWDVIFGGLKDLDKVTLENVKSQLKEFIDTAKDLQPSDIKDLQDALDQINAQLIMKNSIAALKDSKAQLKKATKDVEKYKKELEDAKSSGDTKKVAEANEKLIKARKKQASAANNEVRAEKQVKESVSELGNELKNLGDIIGGTAGEFMNLASVGIQSALTISDNIKTIKDGATALEESVAILAIIQAAFTAIQGISNLFDNRKEFEHMNNQYSKLIDIWDELIEKKKEYINISYGGEAKKSAEEIISIYEKEADAARKVGEKYLGTKTSWYNWEEKRYSIAGKIDNSGWNDALKVMGASWSNKYNSQRITDLFSLSAEQLKKLKQDAPYFWSQLDSQVLDYLDKIVESNEAIEETKKLLKESIIGTSFDSFYDDFVSVLSDMDKSSEDMARNFEEYLKSAILQSLMANKYKDKIQALYDSWATMSDSDGDGIMDLTEGEVEKLREQEKLLAKEMMDERNSLADIFGWTSSATEASAKGFSAMTQDTGNELNGRFASLQISGELLVQNVVELSSKIDLLAERRDSYLSDILIAHATTNSWLESTYNMNKQIFTEWGEYFRSMEQNIKGL